MNSILKQPDPEKCLKGFDHVNRYWDRTRNCYVAKILPGEFYVTRENEMIATTLGSCVSACVWDEKSSIGGMNHFMLPITEKECHEVYWGNVPSDATRYGNYAMEHLVNEILANGGVRKNLRVKVFGGGNVLRQVSDIGKKNAEFVIEYIDEERIRLLASDLGDVFPRKVLFNPKTGMVMVKKLRNMHNDTITVREKDYQKSIVSKSIDGDIELFD